MTKYPPLPTSLDAPGGTVEVVTVDTDGFKHNDGIDCWGMYDESTRRITICGKIPPRHRWKVYYHEVAHVAIVDSGLDDLLDDKLHEALCNAFAAQRMRERFGGG